MKKTKIALIIFIIAAIVIFYVTGTYEYFELKSIQRNLDFIRNYYDKNPLMMIAIYLAAYIGITSLSMPGAIVLTLLAGAIFGVIPGSILVSIGCTTGATIAFFMSRYLFRDSMMKKYEKKLVKVNERIKTNGNTYLFTLRLIPVSPYVVINVLMGLTPVKAWTFIWITFVGMFPGNMVYVYAGRKISEIKTPAEILTWPIILTLTFLGVLPWILKKINLTGDRYEEHRRKGMESSR